MNKPELFAAIDVGSNSFHMVIAKLEGQVLKPIERIGEKVQLARGLENGLLAEDAMQRGWECFERFSERLRTLDNNSAVRIVGTNALRAARNGQDFIDKAEEILGYDLDIIAGREEARLVYLGVAHTLGDKDENRLVIDIGGGSTELIIGRRFEASTMESLHMGCVSYMQRFFKNGEITEANLDRAYRSACIELENIKAQYMAKGWSNCVGSSGTLQAVEQVLINQGWSDAGITKKGLLKLKKALLGFEKLEEVKFNGLKENRRTVFASGIAIVLALFDSLKIEFMSISSGALREGVLYDLIGRLDHEDVRERTVSALEQRYDLVRNETEKVEQTALHLWQQVADEWRVQTQTQIPNEQRQMLAWAARLHEVGMAISHSQFHKHGEYIIGQSDLAGFSKQNQRALATLVRGHRRKYPKSLFETFGRQQESLERTCIILRLAVLLKHSIPEQGALDIPAKAKDSELTLTFSNAWLAERPLTLAKLEAEQAYLSKAGYSLVIKTFD